MSVLCVSSWQKIPRPKSWYCKHDKDIDIDDSLKYSVHRLKKTSTDIHLMSHVKVKKGGVTSQNFEIWHKLR